MAYREGKFDMLEEVKEIATNLLASAHVNPFRELTGYEQGQMAALAAIIESCNTIEEALSQKTEADVKFDA